MEIQLHERWKLVPRDSRNWELCEWRASKATNLGGGEEKWMPCGRFYSYDTIQHAIAYVADERLKAGRVDEAMALREIAEELRALYGSMAARVEAAMRNA